VTEALELPRAHTQTAEFIDDPNSVVGRGADRMLVAQGDYGIEVMSYQGVATGFRDKRIDNRSPDYFDKLGASDMVKEFVAESNFNMFPQEKHDRVRKVSVRAFMSRGFDHARDLVREVATGLIDGFIDRGHCNFVADFSHHLAIGAIARFCGVPAEDVDTLDKATVELRLLGQVPIQPGLDRLDVALGTLKHYGEDLVRKKRKQPADDYISDLIRASDEDGALSETELFWSVANVLLAGHDTTRYQMAALIRAVIQAGDWERVHQDNDLIPPAVDEAMRLYPGVPRQTKVVREAIEIGGYRFRPGEVIVLNVSAAGRDPTVFDNPDTFIIGRNPQSTIGFGLGNHHCLGHMLARTEMEEALRLMSERVTDITIDGPIEMKPTGNIAGIEVLPLRFAKRA
jgi:cytochrome P450